MDTKRLKAALFILSCCVWLFIVLSHARAQEYRITEAELSQLETIWQNLSTAKDKAQNKADSLQKELNVQKETSENLQKSLKELLTTSNSLRLSLEKSEAEAQLKIQSLQTEIQVLKQKIKTYLTVVIIESVVIAAGAAAFIIGLIINLKK